MRFCFILSLFSSVAVAQNESVSFWTQLTTKWERFTGGSCVGLLRMGKYAQARKYFAEKKYPEAAALYLAEYRICPRKPVLLFYSGISYYQAKDWKSAEIYLTEFTEVITKKDIPKNFEIWMGQSFLNLANAQFRLAQESTNASEQNRYFSSAQSYWKAALGFANVREIARYNLQNVKSWQSQLSTDSNVDLSGADKEFAVAALGDSTHADINLENFSIELDSIPVSLSTTTKMDPAAQEIKKQEIIKKLEVVENTKKTLETEIQKKQDTVSKKRSATVLPEEIAQAEKQIASNENWFQVAEESNPQVASERKAEFESGTEAISESDKPISALFFLNQSIPGLYQAENLSKYANDKWNRGAEKYLPQDNTKTPPSPIFVMGYLKPRGLKNLVQVPIPSNYDIQEHEIRFDSKSVQSYRLLRGDRGNIFLSLQMDPKKSVPGKLYFRYSIQESNPASRDKLKPNSDDMQKLNEIIPPELLNKLDPLINAQMTSLDKAVALSGFVRTHGIYTTDSDQIDQYLKTPNGISKWQRMAKIFLQQEEKFLGQGMDCDTWSEFYIGLARHYGIPAKLVLGYTNLNGAKQLHAKMAHGWVKVYSQEDQKWYELEPIPGDLFNGEIRELKIKSSRLQEQIEHLKSELSTLSNQSDDFLPAGKAAAAREKFYSKAAQLIKTLGKLRNTYRESLQNSKGQEAEQVKFVLM